MNANSNQPDFSQQNEVRNLPHKNIDKAKEEFDVNDPYANFNPSSFTEKEKEKTP